jgi:hypothetical protein
MPHTYVKELLKQGYKGSGDDRSRHKDPHIHISDLYKLCPRAFAMCTAENVAFRAYKHVGMQLGYVFDMGNKIQDIFTMRLMKTGMMFGTWECLHCGAKEARFQTKENVCQSCGSKATQYIDTTIQLQVGKLIVAGNVDTMLRQDGVNTVIFPNECKSIKPSGDGGFDTLEAPLRDHGYQVNGYMWILKSKGAKILHKKPEVKVQIAKDVATISYAVKGNAQDPFKVFTVAPDPVFIARVEEKLEMMNLFLTKKKMPPQICKTEAAMMARECPARTMCFGRKW